MKNCILTLLIIAIVVGKVHSCSAIVLKNNQQIFLAKNFDWTFRQGVILKNLRGLPKPPISPIKAVRQAGSASMEVLPLIKMARRCLMVE